MKVIKGNLIDLAEQGEIDILVHGCNCFCRMKSGIAKEITDRYPQVAELDAKTEVGLKDKLGTIGKIYIPAYKDLHDFYIVNAYTQYLYGRDKSVRYVDYDAVQSCFRKIADQVKFLGLEEQYTIGYPKIGCGLANGDWKIVSKIIDKELDGLDHVLVELPD